VLDAAGSLLDDYAYGAEGGNDNSLVRDPELSAAPMIEHATTGFGDWSPGASADGLIYAGNAFAPDLSRAVPGIAGVQNSWTLADGPPNEPVIFLYGLGAGQANVPGCPGLTVNLASPRILGNRNTNGAGAATLNRTLPATASGRTMRVQAVFPQSCVVSNPSVTQIQ
jgi:hypothetical protein